MNPTTSVSLCLPGENATPGGADATAVLRLDGVSKSFGRVQAVDDLSLEVRRGEILTLLGPSGCGKTTTLRMVIGLERCDCGEIVFGGRVVDSPRRRTFVPTHKRNMGMVFQSYAIWPHLTVFENVAYPLRVRRVKGTEVRERVGRVLHQVGLDGLGERPATMLSGGQQQRVAVARALVFEPDILLMDEPFSNLDAKLREQMRAELKVLQRRLGFTVLFVTHDQIEAMSLSDRVVVMHQGRVEQVGSPQELYREPATPNVRDFLGRTILLAGDVTDLDDDGRATVTLHGAWPGVHGRAEATLGLSAGDPCWMAIRPEQIEVSDVAPAGGATRGGNTLPAIIEALLFIGDRYEAQVRLPWDESTLVYLPPSDRWQEGRPVFLTLPTPEVRIWPR
jgi:ABC-type Fe3+/spermidine/putrescine transport system ATPase subunit